jgi:hypothetical protein
VLWIVNINIFFDAVKVQKLGCKMFCVSTRMFTYQKKGNNSKTFSWFPVMLGNFLWKWKLIAHTYLVLSFKLGNQDFHSLLLLQFRQRVVHYFLDSKKVVSKKTLTYPSFLWSGVDFSYSSGWCIYRTPSLNCQVAKNCIGH